MKSPLISCIVPVFNGERYLRETLDSILAQTYRPIEIIVVDDGSTDDTAAVVGDYNDKVRSLKQNNAGPPAARNLGLDSARGDFVAFLDADDLWHIEKLSRQKARFDARPELDLCITKVQNFWAPELAAEEELYRNHRISQPTVGYLAAALLARRSVFETVGRFNPALRHADKTEWFSRALEKRAVLELLPEVLVYRRLHRTNLSRTEGSASRDEYLQFLKDSLDHRRRQKKRRVGFPP